MRKYEYLRKDKWSKPIALRHVVALAAKHVLVGHGPFAITRDGELAAKDLKRFKTLKRLRLMLEHTTIGPVFRVRTPHRVVFTIRRIEVKPKVDPRRGEMVKWARFMIAHEPSIHYSQVRPYHHYNPGTTFMTLDCSSSTIMLAKWAGAPDPSGLGFSGYGNSTSIAGHLHQVEKNKAQPGDIVVWGISPTHHVAVVLVPGEDPLLESHGWEGGPQTILYSVETRVQQRPARFFSLLGDS